MITLQPPKGMRDFYPEDMRIRNRIFDAWRHAANLSGFEPYDACIVESLETLQRKAGEEIVNQIYAFEDKSGRKLALRPELTPSLARMVVARQEQLPLPLKWFAVAQCFRYERMMRGRKREHYQWNLDIIGAEDISAEAEILYTAVIALRTMGVPDEAYRIRINNRALLSELLAKLGIPSESHAAVFLGLDKRGKLPDDELRTLMLAEGLDAQTCDLAFSLLDIKTLEDAEAMLGAESSAAKSLRKLFALLALYGITPQVVFDISVIRGLSYYTGIVFEAFDTQGKFRAIFGGGRYDGLLSTMGGRPATAVGLGFGDVVIAELLAELQGGQPATLREGMMVGYMTPEECEVATRFALHQREQGISVSLQLDPQKPKHFFSAAAASTCLEAVYIGPDDRTKGSVRIKDLNTRTERIVCLR